MLQIAFSKQLKNSMKLTIRLSFNYKFVSTCVTLFHRKSECISLRLNIDFPAHNKREEAEEKKLHESDTS